jgi:murein DD-endopeptidase MepM/ murein hydrolase activator NlpD
MKSYFTKFNQFVTFLKTSLAPYSTHENLLRFTAIVALSCGVLLIDEISSIHSSETESAPINSPPRAILVKNEETMASFAAPGNRPLHALQKKRIIKYGFDLDTFKVSEQKIKKGDTFFSVLMKRGLTYGQADNLIKKVKPIHDFKNIQPGKQYSIIVKDKNQGANYLIYELNAQEYFVFNLKAPSVKIVKRKVKVRQFEIAGNFKKTFWSTLITSGLSNTLTGKMQKALKNKIDLNKFGESDQFKLVWDESFIEGHSVGNKKLKGVYIKKVHEKNPFYAFYYASGKDKGWFEKDCLPVRDSFLKAPLKHSRITSYYDLNRLHPVLHYHKPHYGTDYAAPYGTPIYAVAKGIVKEAKFKNNNGNYVKIEHIKPYKSQYLHMSRFAVGIKSGSKVKQGQVIGYVGATGLATGPHVCFRFWKEGNQINHLKEKFFSATDYRKFKKLSSILIARLDRISIQ